jgi:hypothetical protein
MAVNPENCKRPRVWPGMPTRGSQMWGFVLGFFPGWIALLSISIALLLPSVQSCRQWARDNARQAPPEIVIDQRIAE